MCSQKLERPNVNRLNSLVMKCVREQALYEGVVMKAVTCV